MMDRVYVVMELKGLPEDDNDDLFDGVVAVPVRITTLYADAVAACVNDNFGIVEFVAGDPDTHNTMFHPTVKVE